MGNLRTIPISMIRENVVALRTVDRTSERYLGLVGSIREQGFFGAITVRPQSDSETGEDYFELVDGLHRFSAAKDAGLAEINVDIVDLDQDQLLENQILMNIHKVETKPVEYSNQLKRILTRNPTMTEADLASKLCKSPQWVRERLGLTKIDNERISALIDEGKIKLANAYALAKLPPEEMEAFIDQAMVLGPDEFVPSVHKRVKEIKDAKRKGRDASIRQFSPVAHMQKMRTVKDEMENPTVGPALVAKHQLATAEEGFAMGVKWCLNVDPESIAAQKAKWDEREAKKEAAKKKREEEREAKKAEKEAKKAAEAAEAAADVTIADL
jgi:ParB/RepB/Spo0J family partition protein